VADDQAHLEELGHRAERGEISWRAAAREAGMGTASSASTSLKNHMEQHYASREERAVESEMELSINEAIQELRVAMRNAPAEVKPLYLVAIQNVQELRSTKPSQQHLIQSLKTIQEMTGMKQEQRLMLQFAEAMFREVEAKPVAALPPQVIDVEEVQA
jgi:hypothetical protein